jgi:hypothetical protein
MRNDYVEIQHLKNWCVGNQLKLRPNPEVFFVNGRTLIKPEFVINNEVYIDLVNDDELTDNYIEYCKAFSRSFGAMIIIKRTEIHNIHNITKEDIENKFDIKF